MHGLEVGDESAHAVADEDHGGWLGGEFLVKGGEVFAQAHGGVEDGPASGVVVGPELELPAQSGIGSQFIEDIPPHAGVGEQAVHEDDGDTVGIVGFEHGEFCILLARVERPLDAEEEFGDVARHLLDGGGEIGGKGEGGFSDGDSGRGGGVVKGQAGATRLGGFAWLKAQGGGDRLEEAATGEIGGKRAV